MRNAISTYLKPRRNATVLLLGLAILISGFTQVSKPVFDLVTRSAEVDVAPDLAAVSEAAFAAPLPLPNTTSEYCNRLTTHFGGNPPASGIFLTIANLDANSIYVEIKSATASPVDLLLVENIVGGTVSGPTTPAPGVIRRTVTWATPPTNVILNVLWSHEDFGGNWQLSPAPITVPFAATCAPPPASAYCDQLVTHFGGNPPASGIFLTIANLDANSIYVEIKSATASPVDLLLVENIVGGTVSGPTTPAPGVIRRTVTWATPPMDVILNVLWSHEDFGGNWQLSPAPITVPFAAVCAGTPPPPPPPTTNITFCVNYTCVAQTPGFAAQQIFFQGGPFDGFRPLTNTGNNIWCGTFALPAGEVRYNFFYAGAAGAGGPENLGSLSGQSCVSTGAGGLKRTYTVVTGSPATLTFAWESCISTPNCPPPAAPTTAPPAPNCLQENVISLFSDAYTNVGVDTWLTPWSSAAGGGIVSIAGNNTRLYTNVNFLGIETTGANRINATEMANFHIDIWTPNMTTFRVKLVDFGANGSFGGGDDREGEIAFTPVQGGWNSYVIPLASFQAVGLANRANIAQLILSGIPVGQGTLYVDNIFFSRTNCEVSCLPVVTCNDQTVTFNGQNSIALVAGQLATASGNCGTPTLSLSPNGGVITCLQLGQVVPVTVTAAYAGNNTASCTSNITVAGLPCGWSQNPNGVNCANGSSIAYNSGTGVWTATSTNCFYGPGFTSDQIAFAQRSLCGDGSITAQVTSINGSGWAGVVMRESNAAGAKKAQLMTNLSNFSRREFRTVTNAAAQPQQFPSQNRYWLRLVRAGNQFSMFVSPNGMAWYLVGTQNIVMGNCIQMGLVATNYTSNSTVTATFANVSYSESNTSSLVQAPSLMLQAASEGEPVQLDFGVYPNPTTGELNIDLAAYAGRAVRIELYSADGKLLKFSEVNEIQTHIERIDLSAFKPGMYMLKVKCEGLPDASRRVVLLR